MEADFLDDDFLADVFLEAFFFAFLVTFLAALAFFFAGLADLAAAFFEAFFLTAALAGAFFAGVALADLATFLVGSGAASCLAAFSGFLPPRFGKRSFASEATFKMIFRTLELNGADVKATAN